MRRSARRLVAVLFILISLVVVGALATGDLGYVTTSGVSMLPIYHQGDLVVVAKADSYKVGEIIAYRVPAKHLIVLHRIIGVRGGDFVMKGDNNQSTDPTNPAPNEVVGRAVLLVPNGGIWLKRLVSPLPLTLITFLLLTGGGATVHTRRRRHHKGSRPRQRTVRAPRLGAVTTRHLRTRPFATAPVWLRSATSVAAVAILAGVALGAFAWHGPTSTRETRLVPAGLSTTFSYSASVRKTAAYDGTLVTSPETVFRKLTNVVEVHFAYQGQPGSIAMIAELSTPSGWQSTVQLAARKTFGTTNDEGSVQLDLTSLDAKAQAASAVTGLPPEPLSVAVVAEVETASGARYTPELLLSLSPLQLSLAGGTKSLVVAGSTTVRETTTVPRTISALGRHMVARTARVVALALLLAGLLAAGALTLFAILSAPSNESTGIRRRYGALLVPIQAVPSILALSVVDVTDFATLARLAEHHGSLIMQGSLDGADIFFMQVQDTTFRYQSGAPPSHHGLHRRENVDEVHHRQPQPSAT